MKDALVEYLFYVLKECFGLHLFVDGATGLLLTIFGHFVLVIVFCVLFDLLLVFSDSSADRRWLVRVLFVHSLEV